MEASPGRRTRELGEPRERVFARLYRAHTDQLYRFCLKQTGNHALAEEALANVFLEAWRRLEEIDLSRPIGPWLYGVARNVTRNQRRRQRRGEAALQSLGYVHQPHAEDASEALARRQETAVLARSLAELPLGQRQVVSLCLLGDCSYEAAARALEIPVGTVRSRLSRARLNLAIAVREAAGT